jgi:hypothetical protein
MLYQNKRRTPTQNARKEPRVIVHLRGLLEQLQAMTRDERKEASQDQWIPSEDCLKQLLNPDLRQCERVEIIIVYHKFDNGGQSPSWDTVGGVLGISHTSARQYGRELLDLARADKVRGHLVLRHGRYLHFLIKRRTS